MHFERIAVVFVRIVGTYNSANEVFHWYVGASWWLPPNLFAYLNIIYIIPLCSTGYNRSVGKKFQWLFE